MRNAGIWTHGHVRTKVEGKMRNRQEIANICLWTSPDITMNTDISDLVDERVPLRFVKGRLHEGSVGVCGTLRIDHRDYATEPRMFRTMKSSHWKKKNQEITKKNMKQGRHKWKARSKHDKKYVTTEQMFKRIPKRNSSNRFPVDVGWRIWCGGKCVAMSLFIRNCFQYFPLSTISTGQTLNEVLERMFHFFFFAIFFRCHKYKEWINDNPIVCMICEQHVSRKSFV